MRRNLGWFLTSLALLAATGAVLAQDQPKGQLWALHQETVKPSMVAQYEAAGKEFNAMISRYRPAGSDFGFITLASDQFVYTYATRIKDLNGVSAIDQTFATIAKSVGMEKWMELWKRGFAPVDAVRESVAFEPADMGYKPANPRLKDEEMTFFHYDYYFLMPGHEDEADAIARDFTALFKKKNVADGYRLFKAVSGPELPLIVVQVGARDGADYYAANARALAALGDEGQALFARAFAITRRFDSHNAKLRVDLSLPQPALGAPK